MATPLPGTYLKENADKLNTKKLTFMHPTKKAARIAGAVYLSMVLTAPFSLIYVPSKLIVRGNAAATADNILTHETLFRLSIVGDLLGQVIFICIAFADHLNQSVTKEEMSK
jgi:Domain of unknown function (DUF4386)